MALVTGKGESHVNILRSAVLGLGFVALTSCGGGGGSGGSDGGSGGSSAPSIDIALSTSSVTESLIQGLSADIQVGATATVQTGATISGTVYVLIVDHGGVLDAKDSSISGHGISYEATLITNPKLSVGEHKGTIDIEACGDRNCKLLYGSASLDYDLKVTSATNLKHLTPLSGVSDWQPLNGNSQRTAYVPVSLNASRFSPRWLYAEQDTQYIETMSDFTGAGELAVNTTNTVTTDSANDLIVFADGPLLVALQGSDGSQVWSEDLDPHNQGDPVAPAIANGVVYTTQETVDSSTGTEGQELISFDEMTGSAGFTESYHSLCSRCGTAPVTVVGSTVFLEPDNFGSGMALLAFDATAGTLLWESANDVNMARGYALDSSDAYFIDDNFDGLVALDQPTGTQQFAVAAASSGGTGGRLISLDGAGGAITLSGGQFVRTDLTAQTVSWSTPALSTNTIITANAIGNGLMYIGVIGSDFQPAVMAYSTSNGHKSWSWSPPADDGSTEVVSLIATKNLLFVSTDALTYAVDVQTQTVLWSYPLGGGLSISPAGILYIQGADHVAAVNLE